VRTLTSRWPSGSGDTKATAYDPKQGRPDPSGRRSPWNAHPKDPDVPKTSLFELLLRTGLAGLLAAGLVACADDGGGDGVPGDDDDDDDGMVAAGGLQLGDGSPDSVDIITIWESPEPREATDLDFDPATGHLWVTLREYYEGLPCAAFGDPGCEDYAGSTVTIRDPGGENPVGEWGQDTNALHFMRRPTGIAFGVPDQRSDATPGASTWFATCHEWRTANADGNPANFIGPTHWTSDPAVYPDWQRTDDPEANGSHLDMLHATPFCMGVAHQMDAIYWVFNGNARSIDMYDFRDPHPDRTIGGGDHTDGIIYRYAEAQFSYAPNVVSHLDFDPDSGWLFIADTGNGRIARLDPTSGTPGDRLTQEEGDYDGLRTCNHMNGAVVETVIPEGDLLEAPSGLDIAGGELFVTDNTTSVIYAFSLEGELLNQLDTGLPTGSLGGVVVGPDDKVYFINRLNAEVYRIDPVD